MTSRGNFYNFSHCLEGDGLILSSPLWFPKQYSSLSAALPNESQTAMHICTYFETSVLLDWDRMPDINMSAFSCSKYWSYPKQWMDQCGLCKHFRLSPIDWTWFWRLVRWLGRGSSFGWIFPHGFSLIDHDRRLWKTQLSFKQMSIPHRPPSRSLHV